jgi:glutamyl-tRNA synthetase
VLIWGVLRGSRPAYPIIKKNTFNNVSRWFRFLEETHSWLPAAVTTHEADVQKSKTAKSKEGASYEIGLPDTENGVVTRFPPEPSGYLHIGHAKAALLNDYFAHEKYKGTLLLRFDDTNPSKEKSEFEQSIIEDLAMLGIKADKTSFTSDWFQELYELCIRMIKEGKAYADDTDQDTMRKQRMDGEPSKRRDRSVEESLAVFEEMKKGTPDGLKSCIRAKISVDNPNKAMRDPVIYRCNVQPHHRTGDTWKIYPTYDFCCPIVDSLEGVTHALRTIEYRDRNPQYYWMIDALKLRKPHVWDFARLNFIKTLLSKRKLTKFVEDGVVTGWDDPRFPTVRGVRRRGMTIPALREFILKQGPSKNVVNLDWTLIWSTNKKYIDPIAARFTAIDKESVVTAKIKNGPAKPYTEDKPKHAKNKELGNKQVTFSDTVFLEQADAKSFKKDEEITLMNWGNAFVRSISYGLNPLSQTISHVELELHLEGDVKKTEKKVTWLSNQGAPLVDVDLYEFDYLITKDKLEEDDKVEDFINPKTETRTPAYADANVGLLKEGDIIQFDRKGYFRLDAPAGAGKPAIFFGIPTGKGEVKK